jgi:hypothetical protein
VDVPLSDKQTVAHVQIETRVVRHRSSKDLWGHSRDLESNLLPLRVECLDRVLQVTVPRVVPAHQHLPSSVGHFLSTSRMRAGQACLPTTSCSSKTSTMQVNSMCPGLGTLLTLYSGALVMPNWNSRLRSFVGTVGDSSP